MTSQVSETVRLLGHRLDSADSRTRWLQVFVPLSVIYLLTANYGPFVFIDSAAAFHPAWHLVHHGHLWVDDEPLRIWMFVQDAHGHLSSNRPPGLILFSVPAFAAAGWLTATPVVAPAAVAVSLATAAGVANLGLLLEDILSRRAAWCAAMLAGLGTSLWSVAAAEYLPHGIDVLWLTTALLALRARRTTLAGVAFALAITTRPHLAVVALILGIGAARNVRLRSIVAVGLPSVCGLLLLMTYNALVFGVFNIRGGYPEYVDAPISREGITTTDSHAVLTNLAGTLASGSRGVLVLSPFIVALLPGLVRGWRAGPWWARWSAVAGAAYMLVQLRIQSGPEGFLGGGLIYSYRYAIEPLALCAPLLASSWLTWTRMSESRMRLFAALAVLSVWTHAVGAILYGISGQYPFHAWLAWSPAAVLTSQSPLVAVPAITALLVAVVAVLRLSERKMALDDPASSEARSVGG